MSLMSKWIGSTQVYYDDYEHRWVRAIGPDVRSWEMRYGSDFTTAKEFTVTYVDVGAGTSLFTQAITAGDRCLITTAQNENDGCVLQTVGTPFQLASGHPLYFGAKVSISDATQSDFFVGLTTKDTTPIATHALDVVDDGIYFYKLDGVTTIYGAAEKTGTVSAVASAIAMGTSKAIYEIYWDGATLFYYHNGALVTSIGAGYPTVVLAPTLQLAAGAAAEKTGLVEWMRCIQL
jgi:hypothetical protein